jgi:acetylornithine deacetylase/succinyl-diaminopimelate desuccinylase-like protein
VATESPASIYQRPVELLQRLIRFDTTNPPGNESACIAFIRETLAAAGIESSIFARDPGRPNLIARIRGRGEAPPLLLYGHVDVVTTAHQEWTHPPFGGEVADGHIWGRGTLDMKSGVAMFLAAFLRAHLERASLPGDVIFCAVADEENTGEYGAKFLVNEHPEQFTGVRYALGEIGGFTTYFAGRALYPVMVAEKQSCFVTATVRGPGGHGSMPIRGGATAKLANFLSALDNHRLPVHITPSAERMISAIADALPGEAGERMRALLNPAYTDVMLNQLGPLAAGIDPILHNTASPTIIRGGEKINVIPSEIAVQLDGRILPGFTADDLVAELRALAGPDVEIAAPLSDTYQAIEPDMGLFATLAGILREADPNGTPVPMILTAVTDGRHFRRLGIQTYGFMPMKLPPEFEFTRMAHAADERIPVEAMAFGTDAVYQALLRFGAAR